MIPAERRNQILDSAATLIQEKGLLSCTLEEVAKRAGVSKPLIYRYFTKRDDLLNALLTREYDILNGRDFGGIRKGTAFHDVIRLSTRHGFDYLYERGNVMQALAQYRSRARGLRRSDQGERAQMTRYFSQKIVATYGVSNKTALIGTIIAVNAPASAVRALKKYDITAEEAAAVWSDFVLGGLAAVSARFGQQELGRGSKKGMAIQGHEATAKRVAATPAKKTIGRREKRRQKT